jgi:glycosyltransferase involved in cell wall biosynthesis
LTHKVVIVAHGHPELSLGGAEVAAYRLFQGLRTRPEIKAWFVACEDPSNRQLDGPMASFKGRSDEFLINAQGFQYFPLSQESADVKRAFAEFISQVSPDTIHFHHYTNLGLELLEIASQAQPTAQIILTLHEYLAICPHFGQMVKTGSMELCSRATAVSCGKCFPNLPQSALANREARARSYFSFVHTFVAPSLFLRQRYIDWGLPARRVVFISNGIRLPAGMAGNTKRSGARHTSFGFFGQINPYKGLAQLLTAIDHIAKSPEDAELGITLNIHGSYLELNESNFIDTVWQLIHNAESRVKYHGPYTEDDLDQLMTAVDWVIVPSIWWENAPLVIEEALARKRPVLCSDIGGMREKVRPGRDGLHFPVGDTHALADLIRRAASQTGLWDQLQATMRIPTSVEQSVTDHLWLYEHSPSRPTRLPA